MRRERLRFPIIHYGWRGALGALREGKTLLRYTDGTAKILNNEAGNVNHPGNYSAIGYLTRRSLEILDRLLAETK